MGTEGRVSCGWEDGSGVRRGLLLPSALKGRSFTGAQLGWDLMAALGWAPAWLTSGIYQCQKRCKQGQVGD